MYKCVGRFAVVAGVIGSLSGCVSPPAHMLTRGHPLPPRDVIVFGSIDLPEQMDSHPWRIFSIDITRAWIVNVDTGSSVAMTPELFKGANLLAFHLPPGNYALESIGKSHTGFIEHRFYNHTMNAKFTVPAGCGYVYFGRAAVTMDSLNRLLWQVTDVAETDSLLLLEKYELKSVDLCRSLLKRRE